MVALATEFGGMNESMALLYADTGDKRWLKACDYFEHRAIVEPLARHEDIPEGKHGNTQVPMLLGELKSYLYTGNETSGSAAKCFWDQVAFHHSFATGGCHSGAGLVPHLPGQKQKRRRGETIPAAARQAESALHWRHR